MVLLGDRSAMFLTISGGIRIAEVLWRGESAGAAGLGDAIWEICFYKVLYLGVVII